MKLVAVLGLLVLVSSFQEADAQQHRKTLPPVDFSAMTCDQFWAKTTPDDRGPFLFWLSGYFARKSNSSVLDPVSFTQKTKALSDYCAKQPNDTILTAAEKTLAN
jgi:hypothetical protein